MASNQLSPIAYEVTSARRETFRRCGIVFVRDRATRVDPTSLTHAQLDHLLASNPRDLTIEPIFGAVEPDAQGDTGPADEAPIELQRGDIAAPRRGRRRRGAE